MRLKITKPVIKVDFISFLIQLKYLLRFRALFNQVNNNEVESRTLTTFLFLIAYK